MADFKQIDEARILLELGEEATIKEIKESFRRLAFKYHPDTCRKKNTKHCEEMFKKIFRAKEIIEDYCMNYRFSFREKDVSGDDALKSDCDHVKRFYDDWFGEANE